MASISPSKFDVLIVGGGIAGLSTAIELSLKSFTVTVLERSPGLQSVGGGMLISPQACKIIDSWGCYERFRDIDLVREKLAVHRYADGSLIAENDFGWQRGVYGYPTLNIWREDYQMLLAEKAKELGVKVRYGCKIEKINGDTPSITLEGGDVITGDLIVGADGIRSKVRTTVLGQPINPIFTDTAYICRVPGELMLSDPLTAPLLTNSYPHGWLAPGRHAVASSGRFGSFYGIILIIDEEHPRHPSVPADARNWETRGSIGELRDMYKDHEPRVRKVLDMVEEEDCRLWRIGMVPDLGRWVSGSGKVVLVGDAAHGMNPYLAQGAAMATEDAATLSECLARCTSPSEMPLALSTYENIRKPRAQKIKAASAFSGKEKHYPDGEQQQKRDQLMAVGASKQVKIPEKGEVNMHPSAWVHGFDVRGYANEVLDGIFGGSENREVKVNGTGVVDSFGEGLIV